MLDSYQIKQKKNIRKNNITSKQSIIDYLLKKKIPIYYKKLFIALNVNNKIKTKKIKNKLKSMEIEGKLFFIKEHYILPENSNFIHGTVIAHRSGFGFLKTTKNNQEYYLSNEKMKKLIHGDIVIAKLQNNNFTNRNEIKIIKIITGIINEIVGKVIINNNKFYVIPYDERIKLKISISTKNIKSDNIVIVKIIKIYRTNNMAIGEIIKILGNNINNTEIITNIALYTHHIPHVWPNKVQKQISNINKHIPENIKKNRINLCNLSFITIDGEDAKDFDDAIYCEKQTKGWKLWVAIADVSYYVRPHTPIDDEAYIRSTSIYFPTKVVPMLPEILSNELCSLKPKEEKLCLVCEIQISQHGNLLSYKFYEAIINSKKRMTYEQVWRIIENYTKTTKEKQYNKITKLIFTLYEMYKTLNLAKIKRGGITFEIEEAKFILNKEQKINNIKTTIRTDAHKLIEECMILANIAAAQFVEKNKEPALYRVHDRPNNENISILRSTLKKLGINLGGGEKPQPKDYACTINTITKKTNHEIIQTILLRSMKQAVYDPENRGHFGLALKSYTHFTSPIRRYSDLLLHRIIKSLIKKNTQQRKNTFYKNKNMINVIKISKQCSINEKRADEAVRDVTDWMKCDFIKKNHIGKIFTGTISNITNFGLFVRLNKFFIEGLIHISSLNDDFYQYDKITQRLIGKNKNKIYKIGDTIKIYIKKVYMKERKIRFSLLLNNTIKNINKHNNSYFKTTYFSQKITQNNKLH